MNAMRVVTFLLLSGLCSFAQNTFTGSCSEFETYLKNTGVTDADGVNHPGWDGATVRHFTIDSVEFKDQKTLRLKGTPRSETCVSALATVRTKVRTETSVLNWIPKTSPCDCGCQQAIDKWQADIKEHEKQHAAEAEEYLKNLNAVFTNYPVQACVTKGKNLQGRLRRAWAQQIQEEINILDEQNEKTRHGIDDADKSAPFPGCTACAPCAAGQQPTCTSCPNGLIPAGGKCNALCGPLNASGYYDACGLSNTNQPVACCGVTTTNGQSVAICSPYRTSICTPQ